MTATADAAPDPMPATVLPKVAARALDLIAEARRDTADSRRQLDEHLAPRGNTAGMAPSRTPRADELVATVAGLAGYAGPALAAPVDAAARRARDEALVLVAHVDRLTRHVDHLYGTLARYLTVVDQSETVIEHLGTTYVDDLRNALRTSLYADELEATIRGREDPTTVRRLIRKAAAAADNAVDEHLEQRLAAP